MKSDPGYFGPNSMMWKVNKEITVLFGGARALLMHAAHPLIAAGARQTSFYQRDPWKRLIRTLSLQNSVTFGTKEEADESAHRINKLHEVIKGKDEVSGGIYDALDHEQLLWVHACLQISSIYFYEKTVKKLSENEKNNYHKENMIAAEMVLIDISKMPKTHDELKKWVIKKSKENKYLIYTDVAKDVQDIISGGPVPTHIKPIWPFIAFTAFHTLPEEFKKIYNIKTTKIKQLILNLNLFLLKTTRPLLPPFFRLIAPARWARQRITKSPNLKFKDKIKI
ncbi:MAG: oxygenase MpaB family protein [Actinomycetota bacterium]|nr:oxygenase MpaB family protein [Actinomycetota bacterium]